MLALRSRPELSASRTDRAELRHEMRIGFERMESRFAQMDVRLEASRITCERLESRSIRLEERLAAAEVKSEEQHASLLKWSFVFWTGAVIAIAGIPGFLRWVNGP